MLWHEEVLLALRLVLATVLGALVGLERKQEGGKHHAAGVRTYAAVALGACLFGLISNYVPGLGNVAAQIVSGIGFLGAGVIIQDRGQVKGLTTAATLWTTAAIGLGVSYGLYVFSILSAAIVYLLLIANRNPHWKEWTQSKKLSRDQKTPHPVDDTPEETP
jgi:putative Mg2+ transporter-C (MgtC) family protein